MHAPRSTLPNETILTRTDFIRAWFSCVERTRPPKRPDERETRDALQRPAASDPFGSDPQHLAAVWAADHTEWRRIATRWERERRATADEMRMQVRLPGEARRRLRSIAAATGLTPEQILTQLAHHAELHTDGTLTTHPSAQVHPPPANTCELKALHQQPPPGVTPRNSTSPQEPALAIGVARRAHPSGSPLR